MKIKKSQLINDFSNNMTDYVKIHENRSLLCFITCGSVDDGKSTLIGRLLYDSHLISEDHITQIKSDSKEFGNNEHNFNLAHLVDGLAAEREQGITIDIAHRYFSTAKRKFIVIDAPGHEQYTRNMVTGASNVDLAVILVDANKGIMPQTRRHTFLCHLLGVRNFILAINKMDLINYDKRRFNEITNYYESFTKDVGDFKIKAIPISALNGDNIVKPSAALSWYKGPTLLNFLEKIDINKNTKNLNHFYMPVQWVNRPDTNFRGFSGRIINGEIKKGDNIQILPSGIKTTVDQIVTYKKNLRTAIKGQSVTLTFKDNIDCSRGDIIASDTSEIEIANQFQATIIWINENPLIPGRSYYLQIGTQIVSASVACPKYYINIDNMEKVATKTLELNYIGKANITTDRAIPFSSYVKNKTLGGFILIDKMTNSTVCAGLINFALRRTQNIYMQPKIINNDHHAKIKNQKPAILWMTGLSGSGKSTIANSVEMKLAALGKHTFLLDGDNLRLGLNKDLGFTDADRIENIRRVGEVAKLMADSGLIVITALISPFKSERQMVREIMKEYKFFEIYVNTPIEIAEKRDVKGLYKKARSGKLKNFTGIDSPYEPPENPEIHLQTTKISIEEASNFIISKLLIYLKS